jgi:hypothetical protein
MAIIHCDSNPDDLPLYELLDAEAEREAIEVTNPVLV